MMSLDPFYLIADDVGQVERLVPLGVKLLQLRLKNKPRQNIRDQISAAQTICQAYGCQFIVNDYWEIAIELQCHHVHLGQKDIDDADIQAIRRAGMTLGVSTHDHDELERALGLGPDYIALGPIYHTSLKVMKFAPQGLDRIGEWKARIGGRPLVAIGGITSERAPAVLAAGADSAAVVTDVIMRPDPETRVHAWLQATQHVRSRAIPGDNLRGLPG